MRTTSRGRERPPARSRPRARRASVFRLDLASHEGLEEALATLARDAGASLGRIDAWINNAGADILTGDGAHLPAARKLDLLLAVDLRGTILASWAAVEHMREHERGGVVINMSWDHAVTGMAGRNPQMFAAVKGGVLAFSKSLARSVAPLVRVNILAPGWIETAFGDGLDAERRREVAQSTPLERWGTPGGRRRGRRLPCLSCRGLSHRPDYLCEWRRCDGLNHRPPTDAQTRAHVHGRGDRGQARRASGLVLRRRLDSPILQDRWLAGHAHARQRHCVRRRSREPSSRLERHVGAGRREAPDAQRRRHYRQGFLPRPPDRGHASSGAPLRARRSKATRRSSCRAAIGADQHVPGWCQSR